MRSYEDSLQRLDVNKIDALIIHDLEPELQHDGETQYLKGIKDLEHSGIKALEKLN